MAAWKLAQPFESTSMSATLFGIAMLETLNTACTLLN